MCWFELVSQVSVVAHVSLILVSESFSNTKRIHLYHNINRAIQHHYQHHSCQSLDTHSVVFTVSRTYLFTVWAHGLKRKFHNLKLMELKHLIFAILWTQYKQSRWAPWVGLQNPFRGYLTRRSFGWDRVNHIQCDPGMTKNDKEPF